MTKLAFIMAASHSGSTLLAMLLGSHPQATTIGDTAGTFSGPAVAGDVGGYPNGMALEVAKKEITVNAICPGFLDTDMTDRSVANIREKTGMSETKAREALSNHNPQGRLIDPHEVAATALWLCGATAAAVNGQAIALSGGEI